MAKKDLWIALRNYHFEGIVPPHLSDKVAAMFGRGDASTRAFASKLSRKLGWDMPFALRAIEEYKKFVYLGNMSDMAVTPSKVIDQVWHEHLLFSRGYREFCRDVLGRDFDHNPELIPAAAQNGVFEAQFDATIEAYRVEFNSEPPGDIWNIPKFKRDEAARVRKKSIRRGRTDRWSDDTPLFMYFVTDTSSNSWHASAGSSSWTSSDSSHSSHSSSFAGFGGGGEFAGGGASREWGSDSQSDSSSSDTSSSDASSSGDSGGSSCSSSSCSSSCGGGGGE